MTDRRSGSGALTEADVFALAAQIDQLDGEATVVASVLDRLRAPGSPEVAGAVRRHALPPLARLYDRVAADPRREPLVALGVLQLLVQYQSEEGTSRLVRFVRARPDDPGVLLLLGLIAGGHRHRDAVIGALSSPLPDRLAGAGFLDLCNAAMHQGTLRSHPFDRPDGAARLESWLTDTRPEHVGWAHAAAAALPFLSPDHRDPLLALALAHPADDVRVEAAYAAARVKQPGGLVALVEAARRPGTAEIASSYLRELGRPDLVPVDA